MDTTTAPALTVKDIEAGYTNDAWLGFGYLGGRRNAAEAVRSGEWEFANVTAADELALRIANEKHWTPERFFQWLNSKDGRWFAGATIGCDEFDEERAAALVR
jgi:hypothetical protein